MAMDIKEIEKLIKESIPDALIEIQDLAGDGNHYSATVTSSIFSAIVVAFLSAATIAVSNSSSLLSSLLVSLHPAKKTCSMTISRNNLIRVFIRNYILSQG